MDIRVDQGRPEKYPCELLLLFSFEFGEGLEGGIQNVDSAWNGFLSSLMKEGDFTGELFQCRLLHTHGSLSAKRVLLAGLGKKEAFDLEKWRGAASKAGQFIQDFGIKEFVFPVSEVEGFTREELAEAFVTGLVLGAYEFNEFKTLNRDKIKEIKGATLLERRMRKFDRFGRVFAPARSFPRLFAWRGISATALRIRSPRQPWLRRPGRSPANEAWPFKSWRSVTPGTWEWALLRR